MNRKVNRTHAGCPNGSSTATSPTAHSRSGFFHGSCALGSIARATCRLYKTHREDLINMKMSPANVAGEDGTRRLMQLIRVWCEQKHNHIQFNILSRQTLLDAQKNPEKYRDLVVRIAGYCAYFVDLSPSQQAEIIARTEEHAG